MALALRSGTSLSLQRSGSRPGAADNPTGNDDSNDGASTVCLGLHAQREPEPNQGLPASRFADATTNRSHVSTCLKAPELPMSQSFVAAGPSPNCGGGRPLPNCWLNGKSCHNSGFMGIWAP